MKGTLTQFQNGDVKGATTEVENSDGLLLLLLHTVGQGGSGRLIHNAQNLQPCYFARILGRLALAIVEIGRHSDHRFSDLFSKIGFGVHLHLLQNHGRNLGRAIFIAPHNHLGIAIGRLHYLIGQYLLVPLHRRVIELSPHKAFDTEDGIIWIGDRLPLGHLPREPLSRLAHRHHRGCHPSPLGAGDNHRLSGFHHRDTAICRSQINAYYLSHLVLLVG